MPACLPGPFALRVPQGWETERHFGRKTWDSGGATQKIFVSQVVALVT